MQNLNSKLLKKPISLFSLWVVHNYCDSMINLINDRKVNPKDYSALANKEVVGQMSRHFEETDCYKDAIKELNNKLPKGLPAGIVIKFPKEIISGIVNKNVKDALSNYNHQLNTAKENAKENLLKQKNEQNKVQEQDGIGL